jgi:hypothetical protein
VKYPRRSGEDETDSEEFKIIADNKQVSSLRLSQESTSVAIEIHPPEESLKILERWPKNRRAEQDFRLQSAHRSMGMVTRCARIRISKYLTIFFIWKGACI